MSALLVGDYPDTWDEYVGQARAKRTLMTTSHAANLRGQNLGHTLVYSPVPGSGKTALVQLTIRQIDRRVHVVSGAINLAKARVMFSKVSDGDIIFYDEFHKVMDGGLKNADWLLHYLENGVLMTAFGEQKVPAVSILGATTNKDIIDSAILDRFLIVELVDYTPEEGAQIAANLATKILTAADLPVLHEETALAVAKAASNQPRTMRRLIHAVRDLAVVAAIATPQDGTYELDEALEMVGVTADGLTTQALEYLRIMYVEMSGEAVGEMTMRRRLRVKTVADTERLLETKKLIGTTRGGRMLTGPGLSRCAQLWPEL